MTIVSIGVRGRQFMQRETVIENEHIRFYSHNKIESRNQCVYDVRTYKNSKLNRNVFLPDKISLIAVVPINSA